MRHILNVVLLTFILTSKSSSVHLLKNILSTSLQNLSLSIISDDCVLYAIICHFVNFINESHHNTDITLALTILSSKHHMYCIKLTCGREYRPRTQERFVTSHC
jgi:hypothetical protein